MDILDAIKHRHSIRRFDVSRDVTDEQVNRLLEAARTAPSAGNLQSYFFFVVRSAEVKKQLVSGHRGTRRWDPASAPVIIVACADMQHNAEKYEQRGTTLYAIQDATLALLTLWFAALEEGLGACWVGAFDEGEVSQVLSLPSHLRPIAMLPIGYPAESPEPHPRKSVAELSKII